MKTETSSSGLQGKGLVLLGINKHATLKTSTCELPKPDPLHMCKPKHADIPELINANFR